jgi:zinc transport system permease protein
MHLPAVPLVTEGFLDFWQYDFNRNAFLALLLVSFCCGAVGSLVVGSRMAFFSDALAHCAFAGVSIGFVLFELVLRQLPRSELFGWVVLAPAPEQAFWEWVTPIMVVFGMLVGFGIAAVRTRSGLSSDTVIGVFFAGAVGLAAMLRKLIKSRNLFSMEDFLFGDPLLVKPFDLVLLAGLAVLTVVVLVLIYNSLLMANFNSSLALSRRVPVRWANYLFLVLLAFVVNLCLRAVGALLINALLIVPAATAINLSRNMRQLFWMTIVLCGFVSLAGQWLSTNVENYYGGKVQLGVPGTIVILCVLLFVASLALGPWLRGRQAA